MPSELEQHFDIERAVPAGNYTVKMAKVVEDETGLRIEVRLEPYQQQITDILLRDISLTHPPAT